MKVIILSFLFTLLSVTQTDNIPEKVYKIAKKGSKVHLQCQDENAKLHVKNAIESWGYWNVTENVKQADFILKFYLRFEGAGVCIVNATFVDPKSNNVLYSTREVTSVKSAKGFDFNTKRSAMRQIVEQVFKQNFIN